MDHAATSPSATVPRKRKRGGGGWKSNTVAYPNAEPKISVSTVSPVQPSPKKEEIPEFLYQEQECIIEDCDIDKFCKEWSKWPRLGSAVHGTHLIPMKCPLPSQFDEFISDENKFSASMAIRACRSKGTPVGMIVALVHCQAKSFLTACPEISSNWSSPEDVNPLGVTLCTLRLCEQQNFQNKLVPSDSIQLIPSDAEVKTFCQLISNYLSRNADHYVAVHCCSGFNLTGFMIACYLIEICNFSVDAAIDAFFRSRPPGIYKISWLQALLVRYDERSFSETLSLSKQLLRGKPPNWDRPSCGGTPLSQILSCEELGGIQHVTDQTEMTQLRDVFNKLSQGLGDNPFDACFPRPIMDTSNLEQIESVELITWRTKSPLLFLFLDQNGSYFVHQNNFYRLPDRVRYGHRKDPKKPISKTILLGEYVVDVSEEGRVRTPRFLVVDLIALHGQSQLGLYNITNRLECARHEVVDPARSSTCPLRLRIKSLSKPSQAESILSNILPSLPHESDGLFVITATGSRRSRPDSSQDLPRFLEWPESTSSVNRADFLSSVRNHCK